MTESPLQSTKRELQQMAVSSRLWAALVSAALVLGLAGPFGTFEELRLLPRLAYWAAIVVTTYFAGVATVFLLVRLVRPGRPTGLPGYALAGAAAGVPVAAIVSLINLQAFGGPEPPISYLALLAYCVAIAAVVSTVVAAFQTDAAASGSRGKTPGTAGSARPGILDRLPAHLRGRLLYMSMQDHYVDVHTDKGSTLVLMRLGDAIAETGGTAGLQIHRSHWVALDAVDGPVRRDSRLFVKMQDGALLPVSRSYAPALKEALAGVSPAS